MALPQHGYPVAGQVVERRLAAGHRHDDREYRPGHLRTVAVRPGGVARPQPYAGDPVLRPDQQVAVLVEVGDRDNVPDRVLAVAAESAEDVFAVHDRLAEPGRRRPG